MSPITKYQDAEIGGLYHKLTTKGFELGLRTSVQTFPRADYPNPLNECSPFVSVYEETGVHY